MIFNLLIVDDEATIRRGLSEYIHWDSYDCHVAATASNGEEAIRILDSTDIDIVITDVKMPVLDGIELAKYIHENFSNIAVIILSGYSEFEYARLAIKYKVTQYILKPAAKNEVIQAVQTVAKNLIISKSKNDINKSEVAFLKDQLFQELTDASTVTDDIKNKLSAYEINLSNYYIAAFQLSRHCTNINDLKELIISQKSHGYCFKYNNLIITIYYYNYEPVITPVFENCHNICEMFYKKYNHHINVGISMHHNSAETFSIAVAQAINALSLNFYSSSRITIFSTDTETDTNVLSADTTLQLYEFENSILHRDFKKAREITQNIFNKLQSSFAAEATVKNFCTQIYLISYRIIMNCDDVPHDNNYLEMVSDSSNVFQLKSIIDSLINDVQKRLTQSQKEYSPFINEAINYIKEHLSEDLSLETLAQIVHMNKSYFSHTFKKECGITVVNYITTLRIARAKKLLANTSLRTFEVSEQIGINDPAYFSALFKKNTGLSPKAYRDQFVHM